VRLKKRAAHSLFDVPSGEVFLAGTKHLSLHFCCRRELRMLGWNLPFPGR
jgi:hypothetical protein